MIVFLTLQGHDATFPLLLATSNAALSKNHASVSLVANEFKSFSVANAFPPFPSKSFKETFQTMNLTKVFRVVSKLLSFCMTAGFFTVRTVKLKQAQRGGSWLKRTRYAGVVERLRTIVKRLVIAAFIVLAVLIVVTSF